MKKLTCKAGLKKNIINKEIFEREIALCQKLTKENEGKQIKNQLLKQFLLCRCSLIKMCYPLNYGV